MLDKNNIIPSYWLLSDDRLPLCNKPENYDLFKAHLKHSILFNPEMIVPDSYIINNLNFRRLIRQDKSIQELISDKIIRIAIRKNDKLKNNTLINVRNEMLNTVKPKEFSTKEYCLNDELEILDHSSEYINYSISDVSKRYTEMVSDIFSGEKSEKILENNQIFELIKKMTAEKIDEKGKIGRAFYYYEVKKYLSKKNWRKYHKKIIDLANAPYLTALPSLVGADPVYSNEHLGAFNIIKGRTSYKFEKLSSIKFSTELGFHSFVSGISMLDRESIWALMDSEPAKEYYNCINTTKELSDENIKIIQKSLKNYQLKIEDEIMKKFYFLKNQSIDGNEKIIENKILETILILAMH